MRLFRIAMVQMNPTVGDVEGNVRQILAWMREAQKAKADLVAFPELAITGYPPEDLLLKPQFLDDNRRALAEVIRHCKNMAAVIGYVAKGEHSKERVEHPMVVSAGGYDLFNAAAIVADQRLLTTYCKWFLPNYGVFDESRYFRSGHRVPLVLINGTCVGVNICEDIWLPKGPTKVQAAAGAELIVNINASPFHVGKSRIREEMLSTRAKTNGVIVTYTNMVGGQDELVFDGNSVIVSQDGDVTMRGKAFQEDLLIADLGMNTLARPPLTRKPSSTVKASAVVDRVVISKSYTPKSRSRYIRKSVPTPDPLTEVYQALVMGVHDYVAKNGFTRVVIGLSGGIDSALTAVIAVDALGAENVLGLFLPSPYTSRASHEDVADLARLLGMQVKTVSITRMFQSYLTAMADIFKGRRPDITEENLQARIRGNLLMAVSNKFGHLVLTTGNKSEMSVGYATLYGDMAGGFAVIKDVPKTMVYQLSVLRNGMGPKPVIPQRILDRPPTAELKPNQTDQDTLPPYDVLDPILKAYVEEDRAPDDIVAMGFDPKTVAQVIGLVDRSEYKRRQAPIGIKITHRAFGKDRRMPITNGYRSNRR